MSQVVEQRINPDEGETYGVVIARFAQPVERFVAFAEQCINDGDFIRRDVFDLVSPRSSGARSSAD